MGLQRHLWLIPVFGSLISSNIFAKSIFDDLVDIGRSGQSWQCIGTHTNHAGIVKENVVGTLFYLESDGDKTYQFSTKDWLNRTFHHHSNKEPRSKFNGKCRLYREKGAMIIGTQSEYGCEDDSTVMNFRFNKDNGDFIIIWDGPYFSESVTFNGSCF